jgi:uncharacterized protein YPO0396
MEAVRERWTDERLDDLNDRVTEGFRRVDDEFRALRAEMNARFDALDAKIEAMQGLMIQLFTGMIGTFLTAAAVLVATQL